MSKSKKVVRYKKPFNLNIGVVIFVIIFIYVIFNVYTYVTAIHISPYEVEQGTMAENNIHRGLGLRDETVRYSDYSGALNYYVREASKVKNGNLICSVDENGDVSERIAEAARDTSSIDAESLGEIEADIFEFRTLYSSLDFSSVYLFKDNVDSALNEALSLSALNSISDYAAAGAESSSFHRVFSESDGIVVYYTDGYENVTTDSFTADMFEEASYSRKNSRKSPDIAAGEAVYKLINSETWHIVVPVATALADELADSETVQLRFLKDGKTTYASSTVTRKGEQDYLILKLNHSMVRYAKDRFLEIELLLNEETGLKIPNSAITEKEFYTIPAEYFMKGGDSDSDGLLVERIDDEGKRTTEFLVPVIYYETDEQYYVDGEHVSAGDRIIKSDSDSAYTVGTDTAKLKGVYNINKGYAVFKQIDILYQSEEYTIVRTGTTYGISLYDHIALDGTKINENDLIR